MVAIRGGLIGFLSVFVFTLLVAEASERLTFVNNGNTCYYCPPGSHMKDSCTATHQTICTPCPHDTYVHVQNKAPKCLPCTKVCHITHQETIRNCSSKSNIICRCKDGYWLRSKHDAHCMIDRPCFPGYGVDIPGTPFSKTECEKCKPGTFSDEYSKFQRCQPHTKCEQYLFRGNTTHNSKCSNASHPSPDKESTRKPGNVKDGSVIKESSTIPVRPNEETRNHTKGTPVQGSLGLVDAILIAVGVTALFCCLCGGLCWKFRCLQWLSKRFRTGDGNSNDTPEKDTNGNTMQLSSTDSADGGGDTSQPGTSTGDVVVIQPKNGSGDRATPAAHGLYRRRSSGLPQLNNKPGYGRSNSRNSDPESSDPLMAPETISEDDDKVFDEPSSPSSEVSARQPLGQAGERQVNHGPLKLIHEQGTRVSRRLSSSNEAFVSSTDQLDADPKKTEMTLAEFFDKAADVLQPRNWKRAMRMLPGLPLSDREIENIEHDNQKNGIAEIKYKCFIKWNTKNPEKDVVRSVLETLEKAIGHQPKGLRNVTIQES